MLGNAERDAALMPIVAEISAEDVRYLEEVLDLLLEAWPARGEARAHLRRAISRALELHTWQSLVRRHRCTTEEGVRLMVALARTAQSGNATTEATARL